MTAAVDRRHGHRPNLGRRRRLQRGWVFAALTVAGLACGSACTAGGTGTGGPAQPAESASSPAIPDLDAQAIRSTIEALNAGAGAGVAQQQATLAGVVEPALVTALGDCAPATTTLHFEPIYRGLRPAPGWAPKDGSLTGTVYALPTLIKVYTGDRITGTDLTTLHLGVQAGAAYLTPLCVG